jgi:hypothetical protein
VAELVAVLHREPDVGLTTAELRGDLPEDGGIHEVLVQEREGR